MAEGKGGDCPHPGRRQAAPSRVRTLPGAAADAGDGHRQTLTDGCSQVRHATVLAALGFGTKKPGVPQHVDCCPTPDLQIGRDGRIVQALASGLGL